MKTIKYLIKMYFKGYRLISLCDYNPETDNEIYCLIHKSKISIDFVIKENQFWILSIKGYKTYKKYGCDYLIE